ncbi:MAG: hypothetical protein PSW75_03055, partial [bacterium]|nr:hypothetical protein [bacterium]
MQQGDHAAVILAIPRPRGRREGAALHCRGVAAGPRDGVGRRELDTVAFRADKFGARDRDGDHRAATDRTQPAAEQLGDRLIERLGPAHVLQVNHLVLGHAHRHRPA